MSKVVCFGEIMLRLNPNGYLRILQADSFMISFAGGEANVAVSLANLGLSSSFITKLPDNELGTAAINSIRHYGVDTANILRGGERIGVYYLEKGASQRPSKVIYDRKGSAIAGASPDEFDWPRIFQGAQWFHFTGITPALSDDAAQCCLEACRTAKAAGLKVSCDLNYRKKLWTKEKANEVMRTLMPYVDVCIANEEDASDVFGISTKHTNVISGELSRADYEEVAHVMASEFGLEKVAITLRTSLSANDNRWAGMLYSGKACYFSKEYTIHIVDRVGGGDSFGAGLIYALVEGMESQEAVDFAVAASCLKHTMEYDFNLSTVAEVESLMSGDASGRVKR